MTSRHLNKLIEGLKDHAGVVFTSSASINQKRTTIDVLIRIKEYFDRVAGQSFGRDEFCTKLLDFLKEQPIKLGQDGSQDIVLAVERSYEVEDTSPKSGLNR